MSSNDTYNPYKFSPEAYSKPSKAIDIQRLSTFDTPEAKLEYLQKSGLLEHSYRQADSLAHDIIITGEHWLTDVCCPSIDALIFMHLAKELIVNYQVDLSEAYILAERLYQNLDADTLQKINNAIAECEIETPMPAQIQARLQRNFNINSKVEDADIIDACTRNLLDINRRSAFNKIIEAEIHAFLEINHNEMRIANKPIHQENKHYIYCGPPASGKSTLAYDAPITEAEVITISTDSYRGFKIPDYKSGTKLADNDIHIDKTDELRNTKGIATQDIAYMIKTLVIQAIKEQQILKQDIPNFKFDGVTFSKEIQDIFTYKNPEYDSKFAFFSGLHGGNDIAVRAHGRAISPNASAADEDRYIKLESLFKQHATASKNLFNSLPNFCSTDIFNTNVEKNTPPQIIATVDPINNKIEIYNFLYFSDLLIKSDLNTTAKHPVELLYLQQTRKQQNLITTVENRAMVLKSFLLDSNCTLHLKSSDINGAQEEYAIIHADNRNIKIEITNHKLYLDFIEQNKMQSDILNTMFPDILSWNVPPNPSSSNNHLSI